MRARLPGKGRNLGPGGFSGGQIQERAMKATIPIPTSVRTFNSTASGPKVRSTATRSTEKGPTAALTEVVRKSLAALSGRKVSESFVKSPPRKSPRGEGSGLVRKYHVPADTDPMSYTRRMNVGSQEFLPIEKNSAKAAAVLNKAMSGFGYELFVIPSISDDLSNNG